MVAKTQSNDLTGTIAADFENRLDNPWQKYLIDKYKSYDREKYWCVGCRILPMNEGVKLVFICKDKSGNSYQQFELPEEVTYQEAFSFYKRISIILGYGESIDKIEAKGGWCVLE